MVFKPVAVAPIVVKGGGVLREELGGHRLHYIMEFLARFNKMVNRIKTSISK